MYTPRKCSATNRLITAKDHAAIQLNIGHVDASGLFTGEYTTIAIAGYLRNKVCVVVFFWGGVGGGNDRGPPSKPRHTGNGV